MNPVPRSADQPTLADIAARAGVSLASVSRVLNAGLASKRMRARVVSAMAELGYVAELPSATRKAERMIGVIVADLLAPYFAEMLRGVEEEAETGGSVLMLLSSAEEAEREQWAIDPTAWVGREAAGILVVPNAGELLHRLGGPERAGG